MALHRFFVHDQLAVGVTGLLAERQAKQILSVLRLGSGDRIVLFNGSGIEAEASLIEITRHDVRFEVQSVSHPQREPDLRLTVGLALLRGARFEVAVQKLTEIGVQRIVPLAADRCVVSFRDARDWEKRAERYGRIIIEALEQSERVTTVDLTEPATVDKFLEGQSAVALVERGEHRSVATVPLQPDLAIAVGPEGGWSDRELTIIEDRATTASLGRLILRAETAAIVAAGTLVQRSYTDRD